MALLAFGAISIAACVIGPKPEDPTGDPTDTGREGEDIGAMADSPKGPGDASVSDTAAPPSGDAFDLAEVDGDAADGEVAPTDAPGDGAADADAKADAAVD